MGLGRTVELRVGRLGAGGRGRLKVLVGGRSRQIEQGQNTLMQGIYLDHNATTPVLPDVIAAMLPFFQQSTGNPSSAHTAGIEARTAIERARWQVAELVGASPSHVLFTSSATEAINTAFHSAFSGRQ